MTKKVTGLQAAMINKIAFDEFTPMNGVRPKTVNDANTWAECIIETQRDKGVFTCLQNAGLVWHDGGKGREAGCGLTDEGFKVFEELNPLC